MVAKVEVEHERRYLKLLQNIPKTKFSKKTAKFCGNAEIADISTNRKKSGSLSGLACTPKLSCN
jgi:hypothetical protein